MKKVKQGKLYVTGRGEAKLAICQGKGGVRSVLFVIGRGVEVKSTYIVTEHINTCKEFGFSLATKSGGRNFFSRKVKRKKRNSSQIHGVMHLSWTVEV